MISIITSVYNQLGVNQLFVEYLRRHTHHPFELIIIDNNSTDGSHEFFEQHAEVVIANSTNYSYPYCHNQGIKAARYELLTFLNNDILVSPDWDKHILEVMEKHQLEIASFATNDHLENRQEQKKLNRRWKWIKYPVKAVLGTSRKSLQLMARLMYGNFERFCQQRFQKFGLEVKEGFSGSSIMMKRSALEKVGLWDERIQAADFDLFLRAKDRSLQQGDIKPMMLATGVYIHHYQRLTAKAKFPPFADANRLISLQQKWGDKAAEYLKHVDV